MKYLIRNQLRLLAFFLIFFFFWGGGVGREWKGRGGSGREGGGEVTAEKSKSQVIYYY